MTTRSGGVSSGAFATLNLGATTVDDPASVAANRAHLRRAAALPGGPVWLRQVHGTRVLQADAVHDGAPPEADGSWTERVGAVCAVMAADCLPILLARRDGGVVAALHAGWRGLAEGVIDAGLAALPGGGDAYQAWLGARIGPDHFLVHDDVRATFADDADAAAFRPAADGRWHGDLGALAGTRLRRSGVAVFDSGLCTASDGDRFFSHRRDGSCGRMAALIWRMPG